MAQATPQNTSKPTALAFALGELNEASRQQGERLSEHSDLIRELPQNLAVHFAPRFEALESSAKDHGLRLSVLEGDKRFVNGVLWVVGVAIVVLGGKAFIYR